MKKIFLVTGILLAMAIVCLLAAMPYILRLDKQITSRFEGRRWELPARIYARPLELYVGQKLTAANLEKELSQLRYSREDIPEKPGEFSIKGNVFTLFSRTFHFPDTLRTAVSINVEIQNRTVTLLTNHSSGEPLPLFRLEPVQYASIYPAHHEDRLLIKLAEVPKLLIKTLLTVEDSNFYKHPGVRPTSIVRAALANFKAGRTVQGGSTLTQQLVKNFFLSSEQTLSRKVNEAIMALLLEYHYSKDEILEAYLNEVYLGQDGQRAIHGFAMASRFYYSRDLAELEPPQIATLIGIVKGASYYNPRIHPQRAQKRRNQVLDILASTGSISLEKVAQLKKNPLTVTPKAPSGITPYPAFLQLVRRQLRRDYKDEDLRSEGLSIFTTLDPIIQQQAENSLNNELAAIEKRREDKDKDALQGAMVIASVDQGEVVAVVGDRAPRQAGFNRALDIKRPIGSVIKPAVYLTALSRPGSYNLLTTLYDIPLKVPVTGEDWQPENYDHTFHGPLPLLQALEHSYNVATVQLGMDLGLDAVINTLHELGVREKITPNPSLLLGTLELPPIDVLQMYQTIAADGYKTPLRAILAVTDQQNNTLQRYPLTVQQAADPAAVFCLTTAMQAVTTTGTARSLQHLLPKGLTVAGKTGTTDKTRDSWFAGFSGRHVAVAWVGRDDNKPTGLTGATGALRVWAAAMTGISTVPLQPQPPETIDWYYTDISAGKILNRECGKGHGDLLPFIHDGLLPEAVPCRQQYNNTFEQTLQKGVNTIIDLFK